MIAQIGSAIVALGTSWVAKKLNAQPVNVSQYFSGNGEYLANVTREIQTTRDIFTKYASQLPEGSPEANEYVQLSQPALDWQGQRNAIPLKSIQDSMVSEGQRLVSVYNTRIIAPKPAEILNKVTDPIQNFLSLFSTQKEEPEQAFLAVPKTDTVIPILIQPEKQAITVEQPAITLETKESATKETGFDKFILPVGIAVASGFVLLMLRR